MFSSPSSVHYSKCKDTGSGLFGYRREQDSNGKIIKNSCGDGKTCKRNYWIKYIITGFFQMHLGMKGFLWFLNCLYVLFPLF